MQVQGKANEPFNILDVTHVYLQTLQFLSKIKGHLKFNATENKNILNIFLYLLLLKNVIIHASQKSFACFRMQNEFKVHKHV